MKLISQMINVIKVLLIKLTLNIFEVNLINLYIQIMSKKLPPQNKQTLKNKPQTVDQQNEPFLKTLAKRVRNINKKLTQITDLEAKQNLKPEQVQKINRKDALVEERTRIEETVALFKETYAENAATYRAQQLKQLEVLARGVALYHSGVQLAETNQLSSLWRALDQADHSSATVNDLIISLSSALKDFANDRKLQKSLSTYVEEHGNDKIEAVISNEEHIVKNVLVQKHQDKLQVKPQTIKVEKVEPIKEVPKIEVEQKKTVVPEPAQSEPVTQKPVVQKVEEAPKAVVEQHPTPILQEVLTKEENKPEEKSGRRDHKQREYHDKNNRGNYKGDNRGVRKQGEDRREKRQYKPKYEERQGEKKEELPKEQDSSDSEPEVRRFRKDEIKELQNDGFIVTGKAKPKPKDPREQRQNYERQHGKKPHTTSN